MQETTVKQQLTVYKHQNVFLDPVELKKKEKI